MLSNVESAFSNIEPASSIIECAPTNTTDKCVLFSITEPALLSNELASTFIIEPAPMNIEWTYLNNVELESSGNELASFSNVEPATNSNIEHRASSNQNSNSDSDSTKNDDQSDYVPCGSDSDSDSSSNSGDNGSKCSDAKNSTHTINKSSPVSVDNPNESQSFISNTEESGPSGTEQSTRKRGMKGERHEEDWAQKQKSSRKRFAL